MQPASDRLGRGLCQDSSAGSMNSVDDPVIMDGR